MFMAVAEKKGGGSFLRTRSGRTARPPAGGVFPPKRRVGGKTPPASRRDERGDSPVKRPPNQSPERSESAFRRGGYGGA